MVEIVYTVIRLGVVKPECVDAKIIIIFLADFPYIFSCFRIKYIDLNTVTLIVISLCCTALSTDQKATIHHRLEVFTLSVNRWPYRNDYLNAHGVKLVYHCLWIWPILGIKFPIALNSPVEEINHDLVNMNAFLLVLTSNAKNLILCAVTKLALPKSHTVFWELRCASCYSCIIFQNLLWSVSNCKPIIHLLGGTCSPFSIVLSECNLSDSRIVPQHTIAEIGYSKRNTYLGISLGKLKGTSL